MLRLSRQAVGLASLVALLVFPATAAHAIWPHDTYAGNVGVCTATGDQTFPSSTSDGAGGSFVVWMEHRGVYAELYGQHLNASGVALWAPDGVPVWAGLPGGTQAPVLVSDGAGGVIVAYNVIYGGGFWSIEATRLNAAGQRVPGFDGVTVASADHNRYAPMIVADGAGGAIIVWYDYRRDGRPDGAHVYAQKVSASGTMLWTSNGVPLTDLVSQQAGGVLASDGAGGAIFAWQDFDYFPPYHSNIYAQRVNAAGARLWGATALLVCGVAEEQYDPAIVTDAQGGAILTWVDERNGGGPVSADIYAQRLDPNGAFLWTASGTPVCTAAGAQNGIALTAYGVGGSILAWRDTRNGSNSGDVYAQRLVSTGQPQWAADGVPVCTATGDQSNVVMVPDGFTGAVVAWTDFRESTQSDIYAQRVNLSGVSQWATDGVALSRANGNQSNPTIVPDGVATAGAIVCWQDDRTKNGYDIYAQRVDQYGYLGAEPVITSIRDLPNDQGGHVKVSWNASWLDGANDPNLATYDIYRAAPGTLQWQFVATVPVVHFLTAYSYLATTTIDSTGSANQYTKFMIVARSADVVPSWSSQPDSGYSVDNLPPSAVTIFGGDLAHGAATLRWNKGADDDVAAYRLYRGRDVAFVPAADNFVAETRDTAYVDAASERYFYKVCVVDAHGNASGFATTQPFGAGDEPAATPPAAVSLAARATGAGAVQIRWALPRAADASLTVHTVAGRLVRTLESGSHAAGEFLTTWDGRDEHDARAVAGVYLVRLTAGGRTLSARVLRLP